MVIITRHLAFRGIHRNVEPETLFLFMKITATKIKRELVDKYGWYKNTLETPMTNAIISNTLAIINNILIKEKGGKIK